MARQHLAIVLVRIVLPLAYTISLALRPFGVSLLYVLMFYISALVPVPDSKTFNGYPGRFLVLNIVLSTILLLCHAAWHLTLYSFYPYGSIIDDHPNIGEIAQNIGFVRFYNLNVITCIQYISPDILMFFASLLIYIFVKRLVIEDSDLEREKTDRHQQYPMLTSAGKYLSLVVILLSGIIRPSVTSGIYFLTFMGFTTAWSLGKPLERGFAVVCRCLMFIMSIHVLVLLVYQASYLQNMYPPEENFARYFGLTRIVIQLGVLAEPPQFFEYDVTRWSTVVNPLLLLFTYYVLAIETRELFKPKVAFSYISSKALRGSPDETTPLMRQSTSSKKWSRTSSSRLQQDSTGSVVVPDNRTSESSNNEDNEPSLADDLMSAVIDFFRVLVRSSYIATTIIMMAWSIMFHSWLAFVFLMWANIVWLCHNQRSFMLKTSPVLVIYAMLLLIAQYIYGMDLTEAELPSNITDVNLRQIGLGRTDGEPFLTLLIKSLFTCMFWVTLRQRIQEIRSRRRSAVIADMAAPLQLTVSAAASAITPKEEIGGSRLLNAFGKWLQSFCARYWIYVVVIMLFVIGITGERMTIFRILYMFLFLAFILMFQISWSAWRRLLYTFWITVIFYSMINLILIYIYQFDNFPKLIEDYLLINVQLQNDLGLEPYPPAYLFVKLLTPTCFLIITIMQVHYFHKDFMQLSDISKLTIPDPGSSRPSQVGASTMKDDVPGLPSEEAEPMSMEAEIKSNLSANSITSNTRQKTTKTSLRSRSYAATSSIPPRSRGFPEAVRSIFAKSINFLTEFKEQMFMFLHLHLLKIVLISLMLLSVINVCAMHLPIMVIVSPALLFSSSKKRCIIILLSIMISVYFMAIMVYQINYINHDKFNVNCSGLSENDTEITATFNDAAWIGFHKATATKPLVVILKGYIAMLALFTFNSLVYYRQRIKRAPIPSPMQVMYPEIHREDADKDLIHCAKYMLNYGFYKFGVEMSLICLIGVIGSRMDMYAVMYAFWLLTLVSISRVRLARVWPAFTVFVMIVTPIQYFIALGFYPRLCIQLPWAGFSDQMKHFRTWFFLPYNQSPPPATKLIFDYFLLVFASRQLFVFRIEQKYGDTFVGGSNREDIGHQWETPEFVNPVPDFLSNIGSWLDVVKRVVFLGMLWITLAIMFLTGTNRVNLFSLGYLIGSFIFLWQGTDFYLRPKEAILKWWSWLLTYNVSVVVIKTLLQIPGCLFSAVLQDHACWLVQLLGIGCVDKFAGGSIAKFIKMQYVQDAKCTVPQEDIGLAWDGVCFAFLILQRRLFHSYYFYRVIDESKATTILASRGAELIEELRQKIIKVQEEQEGKILQKIKVKMEKIKANQKRVHGILAKEPAIHDHEGEEDASHTGPNDDDETQTRQGQRPVLARGDSDASARGYHTPDSPASPRGFHTPISEASAPPSPQHTPPLSQISVSQPQPQSQSQSRQTLPPLESVTTSQTGGPPSPSSALMTVSLDAYLEPRRISFESPPSSELIPRAQSPEESYPVFSPPPIRRRHTIASPSILQRTSIISQSSRAEPNSHHTSVIHAGYRAPASHQQAVRSGDYYMFEEFDDVDEDILSTRSSVIEDEDAPYEMGFGELLSSVIRTDLRRTVSKRRTSAPLTSIGSVRGLHSIAHEDLHRSPDDVVPVGYSDPEPRESDLDYYAPLPHKESVFDKIKNYTEAAWMFISGILVTITRHLMKFSRDYRYVSRTLSIEKKLLKEKEGFGIGIREGSQMVWQPHPETIAQHRKLSSLSVPEIRIVCASQERGLDSPRASPASPARPDPVSPADDTSEHESAFTLQTNDSKDVTTLEEHDDSMFRHERSPFIRLGYALWFSILAHTDIVCYIMVFINQVQSATILSIPLPLMVFLWGTLTIPRPTKTFWVTLIAYTEVIVLIKSMFQFEILPWNQKVIPANMPFTGPRIIGIERVPNYALYDLLLLLIIFFHRFMLKSLGLWKESTSEPEVHEDAEYPVTDEDIKLMAQGRLNDVGKKYLKISDTVGPSPDDAHDETDSSPREGPSTRQDLEQPGPSKAPDDDHYEVHDDMAPIIAVTTTLDDTYKNYPKVILLSMKRYMRPMRQFFQRMLAPGARVTADVYAYMFLCDFFNFLVVIFGFAAFGTHQGDGGVQAYLEENKVPIPFLIMLILQFGLIIIDRALYLRKYILGKILFQYALIIGVHIWMFFVLPFITERKFNALLPPPMWYMLKCFYLLLSAYQIRCGYPRRIIGNFLCKSYRFINMISFRGFMMVPFVFELRTLMDWIWTDTSMTLMDWLKMEDVFANVYLLKCSRNMEDQYPQERGVPKSKISKYMVGGTVLAFVIAIIWFPLVFFAFGNTVGEPNPPTDVTVKLRIGPYLPIYQMSAQSHNIDVYTEQNYNTLSNLYARDRTAQTFLSNYVAGDVAAVNINPHSAAVWAISPPELARLMTEAASNASLTVKFTYVITHLTNAQQNPSTIESSREVVVPPEVNGKQNPERMTLLNMLNSTTTTDDWFHVKALFPKFVKVFNKGTVKPTSQLMPVSAEEDADESLYRDVYMRLDRLNGSDMFWQVKEYCAPKDPLMMIPLNDCERLVMFTFNDKLFPETLNFISGSGIIGLYTTFVFLASRVLRGFFSGIYAKIMFDDLPNVDRVLQLCLDIYLVREALELTLEEDLFAKLVFLYRSPETMIKWSRPKDDAEEQRALPQP